MTTPETPETGRYLDFPEPGSPPEGRMTCPQCHGHGGWNTEINRYQLRPDSEDTAENRHRQAHQRAGCTNCNGHGHVPRQQGDHVHDWTWRQGKYMSEHVRTCPCGAQETVDSTG